MDAGKTGGMGAKVMFGVSAVRAGVLGGSLWCWWIRVNVTGHFLIYNYWGGGNKLHGKEFVLK